jgi:hypothetical protein
MPSADAILGGLTTIANEWRALAIAWHALFAVLLVALLAGWRPSDRHLGYMLTAPVFSVSGLALVSGNPFNGMVFLVLGGAFLFAAQRLSGQPVNIASWPLLLMGAPLIAFGWLYPHFVDVAHWTRYAFSAPLGLVPCPTLAALVGFTLVARLFESRLWTGALLAAAVLYGTIGVFVLGVPLDYGLLAGSVILIGHARHDHRGQSGGSGDWRGGRTVTADVLRLNRRVSESC